jgi:hypothetical protein
MARVWIASRLASLLAIAQSEAVAVAKAQRQISRLYVPWHVVVRIGSASTCASAWRPLRQRDRARHTLLPSSNTIYRDLCSLDQDPDSIKSQPSRACYNQTETLPNRRKKGHFGLYDLRCWIIAYRISGGGCRMSLALFLLWCSACHGRFGARKSIPDNSRFGGFNSRFGHENSRLVCCGNWLSSRWSSLYFYRRKTPAAANRRKFPDIFPARGNSAAQPTSLN